MVVVCWLLCVVCLRCVFLVVGCLLFEVCLFAVCCALLWYVDVRCCSLAVVCWLSSDAVRLLWLCVLCVSVA